MPASVVSCNAFPLRWHLLHVTGMLGRALLQKHDKGQFSQNTDFTLCHRIDGLNNYIQLPLLALTPPSLFIIVK